jgi:hypothetical protein
MLSPGSCEAPATVGTVASAVGAAAARLDARLVGVTVVSVFAFDDEPCSVVNVVSGFGHTLLSVGAPREGNNVSRTVNAAAVPPTAVAQYNNQPTSALLRREWRGFGASVPRRTLRIDTRSKARGDDPLISGCRPSPAP